MKALFIMYPPQNALPGKRRQGTELLCESAHASKIGSSIIVSKQRAMLTAHHAWIHARRSIRCIVLKDQVPNDKSNNNVMGLGSLVLLKLGSAFHETSGLAEFSLSHWSRVWASFKYLFFKPCAPKGFDTHKALSLFNSVPFSSVPF